MTSTSLRNKASKQVPVSQDVLDDALRLAVFQGNIPGIRHAIAAGADVDMYVSNEADDEDEDDEEHDHDSCGMEGNSLLDLVWAQNYGDDGSAQEATMIALIEGGLSPSFDVLEMMETVCMMRSSAIVQAFLNRHAKTWFQDTGRHPYLCYWLDHNHPPCTQEDVRMFLGAGMNPNQVVKGKTLLAWAFYRKDATMVQAMLDQGASVKPSRTVKDANNLVAVWDAVNRDEGGDYDATQIQFERIEPALLMGAAKQAAKMVKRAQKGGSTSAR